jgi:hypothetical protein
MTHWKVERSGLGIDGKGRWKEQQRQKKEMDNTQVNRPGLEARTLA